MSARILCLFILLLEVRGLWLSLPTWSWLSLAFYTRLSNLITALSALLLAALGQSGWVSALRYLSTCMLGMTVFVTICVLIPMGGSPKELLLSGTGLYFHVLCPAVSILSYIIVENHAPIGLIWLPVLLTWIYGMLMLYLNGIGKVDGPYPFFRVHQQSAARTVLWVIALIAAMAGISALVSLCAK